MTMIPVPVFARNPIQGTTPPNYVLLALILSVPPAVQLPLARSVSPMPPSLLELL